MSGMKRIGAGLLIMAVLFAVRATPSAATAPPTIPLADVRVGVFAGANLPAVASSKPTPCKLIGNHSWYTRPIGAGRGGQVTAYFDALRCLIKGATKGSTIRFQLYSAFDNSFAELFALAKDRGVNVRFTASEQAADKDDGDPAFFEILKDALGTNVKKASYLNLCQKACHTKGGGAGFMHDKDALFSEVLGVRGKVHQRVILRTSGNLSSGFTSMWNHSYEIVGKTKLYKALATYFDDGRLNRTKHNYASVTDGQYTVWFYPNKSTFHPAYATLKKVNCSAKKGFGAAGRTVVRAMMSIWESDSIAIAEQLGKLAKAKTKCNVGVVLATNADKADDAIIAKLKQYGVTVYTASVNGWSMHSKTVAVSGTVNGKSRNLVYDGSLNFSRADAGKNDETVLLNQNEAEYKRSLATYRLIVKKFSKRL